MGSLYLRRIDIYHERRLCQISKPEILLDTKRVLPQFRRTRLDRGSQRKRRRTFDRRRQLLQLHESQRNRWRKIPTVDDRFHGDHHRVLRIVSDLVEVLRRMERQDDYHHGWWNKPQHQRHHLGPASKRPKIQKRRRTCCQRCQSIQFRWEEPEYQWIDIRRV